ncbi:MAG TPA: bacterioferritin [Thauera sp.]|nr:bacterioferritin [Thauera sp.]HHW65262.1 bacterioferritin [Rhodocyclaceae bacterium]
MYVCVCSAVTEKQIMKAVDDGIRTLRELRHTLGVAAECGRCARCARDCLRPGAERGPGAERSPRPIQLAPAYLPIMEAT